MTLNRKILETVLDVVIAVAQALWEVLKGKRGERSKGK